MDLDIEDILYIILACIYIIIFLSGVLTYVKKFRKEWKFQTFMVSFSIAIALRTVYFILQPYSTDTGVLPNSVLFCINTFPSWPFFTSYLVVLLMWASLYEKSHKHDSTFLLYQDFQRNVGVGKPFVFVNGLMYVAVVSLYTWDIIEDVQKRQKYSMADSPQEKALVILSASMFIGTTLSFFVHAYLIYQKVGRFGGKLNDDGSFKSKLKVVGVLNAFCMFCFVLRAVLEILQLFVDLVSLIWLVFFYWLILEAVPLASMLVVLTNSYWSDDPYYRSVVSPTTYAKYQSTTNTSNTNTITNTRTPLLSVTNSQTKVSFSVTSQTSTSPQSYSTSPQSY